MALDPEIFQQLEDTVARVVRERWIPLEDEVEETGEVPQEVIDEMKELYDMFKTDPKVLSLPFQGVENTAVVALKAFDEFLVRCDSQTVPFMTPTWVSGMLEVAKNVGEAIDMLLKYKRSFVGLKSGHKKAGQKTRRWFRSNRDATMKKLRGSPRRR